MWQIVRNSRFELLLPLRRNSLQVVPTAGTTPFTTSQHSKILQVVPTAGTTQERQFTKVLFDRSMGAVSNTENSPSSEYSDVTVLRAWLVTFNAQTGLRRLCC